MHGFAEIVCAKCTVLTEWLGENARFNRYDGCGMHGLTGMMGAGYKDFTRMVGGMHGSTGMMGAECTVQPV